MPKPFDDLQERLLRAGVAPRHVRRYLKELADHLADLRAEDERAGRGPAEAESAALARLGGMDDLAKAMIEQRQFQSWFARAPWAMFSLAPIFLLAAAWFVALLILWSGWKIFLPRADTPFVRIDGVAMFYFGVGRLIYYSAPILIGWGIGVVAARQRVKAAWPVASLVLLALMEVTAQVSASHDGIVRIGIRFNFGSSAQSLSIGLYHSFLVLLPMVLVMALPYLIWRLKRAWVES